MRRRREKKQKNGDAQADRRAFAPERALVWRREQAENSLRRIVRDALENGGEKELACQLWETLLLFEDYGFCTVKNLRFSYTIRGNEMFVSRKNKSITRASINVTLEKAIALQKNGGAVTGPKKLGTFGASYLYPIFIRIGVIQNTGEER